MRVNEKSVRRVQELLARTPQAVNKRMKSALFDATVDWEREMQKRFRGPLPMAGKPNGPNTLHTRTGSLRRSLKRKVFGKSLDTLGAKVFSAGNPAARLQELGGVITPKRAQFLTIPMPDNMTPAGVTKKSARAALSEGRSSAGRGGVIFLRTKKGLFIVRTGDKRRVSFASGLTRTDKKGRVVAKRSSRVDTFEFLFRLVRSVKIPPRLGFFKTWDKLAPARVKRSAKALALALRDAKRAG